MNGINTSHQGLLNESFASLPHQSPEQDDTELRVIDYQLSTIRSYLNDLFYDLFLTKSGEKTARHNVSKLDFLLKPKSNYIFERLESLYAKHIYHYTPFIEIKLKRNVPMAYYCYLLPGLVHFSFVNRQDNQCTIPTIDPVLNYNLSEAKITATYRKYVPIVIKLLFNFECNEIRFWDEKLEVVFNYLIWFEDRGGNRIPVDFSRRSAKKAAENRSEVLFDEMTRSGRGMASPGQTRQFMPGITERGFYDQIKSICYPNAPPESLFCYELFSLHSSRLREDRIDKQFKYLVANLSKAGRNS